MRNLSVFLFLKYLALNFDLWYSNVTVHYTVQSGSLDELRCDYSRASYQEVPGEESRGGGGGGVCKDTK